MQRNPICWFGPLAGLCLLLLSVQPATAAPCQVSYRIQNAWDSGFVIQIAVQNNTDRPLDDWHVSWRFPDRAQVTISNSWNAHLEPAGNLFTAQGLNWNQTLAPHGQVSFGFQAEHVGAPPALQALRVTAAACQPPAPVSPHESSDASSTGPADLPLRLYRDPDAQVHHWLHEHGDDPRADSIRNALASQPAGKWFGDWSGDIRPAVQHYVAGAVRDQSWPILVAYNIPARDCDGLSAGGEDSANDYLAWIRQFAAGIGHAPALVVLEPDALAKLDCLSPADQERRYALLRDSLAILHEQAPAAHVYLDAGHPGWHSVAEMTERLLQAGIGQAWGFALNVSHFQRTEDNIHYGQALVERLLPVLGQRKPFIVDTSRNGAGALDGQWCDPSGARLGEMSQVFPTGHSPEMLLWIKPPGEADGCGGPVGQFIPALAAQLIAHH